MDKLVYLTYPAMVVILLFGGKLCKKGEWNEAFMSLEQVKYIQGFLAICIMLHHIAQETCASWQPYELRPGLEFFVELGYFFVAMFLFCSGYGLYKSYITKENYLHGFITKRIIPLIIIFFSSGWIFLIARILMHEKINGRELFFYIIGWSMPNQYAWFVIAMPLFYLIFYLSFRFIKTDYMRISGVIIGIFAYTFLGTCIDHNDYWMRGEWWYNCVHLFWVGILFAKYDIKIISSLKKRYIAWVIAAVVGVIFFFFLSEFAKGVVSYYGEYNRSLSHTQVVVNRWICLFTQMIASFMFVLVVLLFSLKYRLGNKLLGFMGKITLEFYLIHGLVLELFAREFCDIVKPLYMIQNVAFLEITVFTLGIIAALGLKKLDSIPGLIYRKFIN